MHILSDPVIRDMSKQGLHGNSRLINGYLGKVHCIIYFHFIEDLIGAQRYSVTEKELELEHGSFHYSHSSQKSILKMAQPVRAEGWSIITSEK